MSLDFQTLDPPTSKDPRLKDLLQMTTNERERLYLIKALNDKVQTVDAVATKLSITTRQCYRLLARYRTEGDAAVVHGLRGRVSNRGYEESTRVRICALYKKQYQGYTLTLFTERLEETCQIKISRETVRRWLIAAQAWEQTRKGQRHRKKRTRRAAIGELVQFDGSIHDWFEGRGPCCCLFVFVDDASNTTFLYFADVENTVNALMALRLYILAYGRPMALYLDRHASYYPAKKLTDFIRAAQVLGIEIIYARSPQAKGRVERANRTHQDRLVKALREADISDIASANRFLQDHYLRKHNAKFSFPDELENVHRPVLDLDLDNILCLEWERQVRRDMTFRLDAQTYQILASNTERPIPRQRVVVRRWLDESLHVFWRECELAVELCPADPRPNLPRPVMVTDDHPWRRKAPIGKAKTRSIKELCTPAKKHKRVF
jgi:transposase